MVEYTQDGIIVNGVNVCKCDFIDTTDIEPTCENIYLKGGYCYQNPMCRFKREQRRNLI